MVKPEVRLFLKRVSYGLFKGVSPRFKAFKQIYEKSGIPIFYESYVSLMLFSLPATFVSSCVIGAVIHHFLFDLALFQYILAVIIFSCVTSLIVLMIFILYPLYCRSQRRKKIDANLVYTAGYMGVLSAGGISIERIFERVSEVEQQPAIKDLIRRFLTNIKVFGLDVISSLRDVADRSPSEVFSRLLAGVTNTVQTSGDLKGLLMFEANRLLHAKREQLKRTLGSLTYLAEIYVTAVVVSPIVVIIMLTILSILGTAAFGLPPVVQMNLLVFLGIPMIATVFVIVLDRILPKEG
jgi:flagellar protein FlaJ